MIRNLLLKQKNQEKIAIIEENKKISYRDLLQKSWLVKQFLPENNQENVALLLPNGSDYIAAFWAIIQAGLTVFPLNILMTKTEILPFLKQANVTIVITTKTYQHLFEEIEKCEEYSINSIFIDNLKPYSLENNYTMPNISSDKPMILLSTSGTMGKAKIVQLSEKNVETAILGYLDKLYFNDLNNVCYTLAVPFSSAYGIMIISFCLMQSFPIVILNNFFTLDTFYQLTEKYRITHYEGSSSVILLMEQTIDKFIPYDIQTLKYFGFGGSKVSVSTIEKLISAYPDKGFYQGYGMTEAAPLITKHPQIKLEKTESVGNAIKGIEISIITNNQITNIPYAKGEIVVRGPNVMLGYLNNKKETDLVLKNDSLYTGDIGYLDNEGYLYICGRKKNIVIIRGFNVYPEEIEDCLFNSKLVLDCLIYGQMDDYGNEVLCADIVPLNKEISEEEIKNYCHTHLAIYKIPKKISFCQNIQKNIFGKAMRY